ncbi:S9 family peptidase [Oleiharenicola lentus]|uniref:S9 family peptidase n=1 Tax=Oleiharenicola lentus TaxID=2508720 RepID=UPI003F679193
MKFRCVVAFVLSLAFSVAVLAAEKRVLTPQDLWAIKRVSAPALSPDGKTAVIVLQEWSIEKNKSTSNLWLVDVASGAVKRLTTAQASDSAPTWSPDGTRLAFTSKRGDDENASLYVMRLDGGEPEKLIEFPFGLSGLKWMPDGQSIVVVTTVIPELSASLKKEDFAALKKETKHRKESKMTAKVTENRQYRYFDHYITDSAAHRLVLVNTATKEFKDLTPKWDRLFTVAGEANYDLSPDGKTIALSINTVKPPYQSHPNHDIYLLPTDGSGTLQNITPENKGDDTSATFSPDGKTIIFGRQDVPFYSGEFAKLWKHDLATGQNTALTESLDYAFDSVKFSADGKTLWAAVENQGVVPVFKLNADGSGLTAVYKEGSSSGLDVKSGTLVFLNDNTSRPNELFALDISTGHARQLTHFNDEFMAQFNLGKVEGYWFTGANNEQIHGWLVYPPNYDTAKKYPLVQLMHGGPHTMNRDSWSYRWNTQLFAAPGYIVTWVDRHGSTGYSEKFASSIVNQWGDMPFEDIMKSTDFLIKKLPAIDPTKLAAAGASYGGYMAAWVLGHTDRFKTIINHAGVNSSYAQYATDVPHGFPEVMGGKPWENLEGMQKQNPMFYAKNFKTPMLILHGELDYRVPYGNGLELYGVLQAMNVPSRLVVFPNENHWVLSPQNAIYWHWEMQSWLSRYLGGKPVLEKPNFDAPAEAAK